MVSQYFLAVGLCMEYIDVLLSSRHDTIQVSLKTWGLCHISYTPRNSLKYQEITSADDLFPRRRIVLKYCTEHDSSSAVLCAKFQTDWTIKMNVIDERDSSRFEFKMIVWGIYCIAIASALYIISLHKNTIVVAMCH